jgi:alpha-tubulin suppressor-like RCC1 family protein
MKVVHPNGLAFTSVATSTGHTVAVDDEGIAWAWGEQGFGRLGTGQPGNAPVPTRVAMPYGVRFVSVTVGGQHAIALDQNGHAWAWGWGNLGQLGTDVAEPGATPLRVVMPPGVRFTVVAAGSAHSLALDNSGRLWGWGSSFSGELGLPLERLTLTTPTLLGTF